MQTMTRTTWLLAFSILISAAAFAADPSGWRADGTGKFPNADVPTSWSAKENVIWKTVLPNWSNASPVLGGNRIFICVEPTTLMCLSAKDGSILWQKNNSYADVLSEADAAKVKKADADIRSVRQDQSQLNKQKRKLGKDLKKDPDNVELKTRIKALTGETKELGAEAKRIGEWATPKAHKVAGFSSPTPVSDGKHVFALFGTGVVVCYNLEGKRVWAKIVERPHNQWGQSSSPLLIGDTLIVHVRNVYGLDTKTGEVTWKHPSEARWGSPIKARIGKTDYAVTANGEILNVDSGKDMSGKLVKLAFCSPMVEGNVLYLIQNGGKAFELPEKFDANNKPEELWKTSPKKDRYYASPVYHDGLIYAITRGRVLSVIDAKTGGVLYSERLPFKGTVYPSIIQLGDKICISSDDGSSIIIEPGRSYKELATNKLDAFRSSPLVVRNRLYVRTLKHLYCIGK